MLPINSHYQKRLLTYISSAFCLLFGTSPTAATDNKQPSEKEQKQKPTFLSELSESAWLTREIVPLSTCPKAARQRFVNPFITNQENSGYRFSADQTLGVVSETAKVAGNVELESNQMRLRAGEMQLNLDNGEYSASEKILVETQQSIITAKSVTGNAEQNQAQLQNANFQLKHNGANGSAKELTLNKGGQLSISELTFSTCPESNQDWFFSADSLELDTESGWGVATDMVMTAGDIPIFYFPWLKFPIDDRRHSGILAPSFSTSDRNGFDFQQPVYWNIAPDYDATITPRYIEKRGNQLGLEFRYLTESSQGQSQVEYLSDRLAPLPNDNRWLYQLQHQTQLSEHWRFDLNASGVSDIDYFNDLGAGLNGGVNGELNNGNQDQLLRRGQIGYFSHSLQTHLTWLRFQPIALPLEPYRQLPQWHLNWNITDKNNPWRWTLTTQATQFSNQDPTLPEGDRSVITSRLSYPLESSWGFFKPAVKLHLADYQQSVGGLNNNQSISTQSYSIDSGLRFERATSSGLQTLEPRLFLLYTPFEEQSNVSVFDTFQPDLTLQRLFSDNRFAGYDRIGDTQQATIGLTSRWFSNTKHSSQSWKISIARAYYQTPRKVTLNAFQPPDERPSSNLISELSWQPHDSLRVSGEFSYNTHQNQTERGRISLMFEPKDNSIVNISHRFRNQAEQFSEQSDVTFAVPLNEKWRLTGRWNHDWLTHHSLETFVGLEYESCCWAIRLLNRRYLNARLDGNGFIIPDQQDRYNSGWFLQFVFKGLGSIGQNGTSRLLEESISGYQDPFLNQ